MPVFGGENRDSYFDEGVTAAMRGDLTRAIEFFEKCIRLDSTYSAPYHQLGKVYHRLGNFQKATAFLSQVVTSKPTQIPPRVDLGYALLGMGNAAKAQELFSGVLSDKADNARARLGLAHCAYQSGKKDDAILIAQEVSDTSGGTFGTFYLIARAASECGREDLVPEAINRATKLIEKSIETSPNQPEGYYLRGLLFDLFGDNAKAEEDYRQAIERAQPQRHYAAYEEHFSLVDMLGRLAQVQRRRADETGAAETLEKIRALDPQSPYLGPAA